MTRPRIILITGMPGSGKTTVASLLAGSGYRILTMGDVVRDEARERGVEPTARNLGLIAEEMRREEGNAAVARRCVQRLKLGAPGRIVVDGVRSLDEAEVFREAFDAVLVAVHSSPKSRFARLTGRGRSDDESSWVAFVERDRRELGFGLGSAIAVADHIIVNEGPLQDVERSSREFLERLG